MSHLSIKASCLSYSIPSLAYSTNCATSGVRMTHFVRVKQREDCRILGSWILQHLQPYSIAKLKWLQLLHLSSNYPAASCVSVQRSIEDVVKKKTTFEKLEKHPQNEQLLPYPKSIREKWQWHRRAHTHTHTHTHRVAGSRQDDNLKVIDCELSVYALMKPWETARHIWVTHTHRVTRHTDLLSTARAHCTHTYTTHTAFTADLMLCNHARERETERERERGDRHPQPNQTHTCTHTHTHTSHCCLWRSCCSFPAAASKQPDLFFLSTSHHCYECFDFKRRVFIIYASSDGVDTRRQRLGRLLPDINKAGRHVPPALLQSGTKSAHAYDRR